MNRLVEEAMRNPFEGIDKPGPLKGDRKGYWSRRITDERRFIYKSKGSAILECIKMCLWWKDFYERLQPVVSGATTVREAVEAVEAVTEDAAQPARVRFGGSEDRCKTPVQMLKFGRGACG
jgi:Txe/YoeB family toxin of toxin-antitoxin system